MALYRVRSQLPLSSIVLGATSALRTEAMALLMRGAPTEIRDSAIAKLDNAEAGDVVTRFTISTGRVDSYDSTVNPKGWDLIDYRANPVVLFAHDADSLPVGIDVGCHLSQDGTELIGVTKFVSASLDEFGAKVGRFVAAGILRATSVGFEPIEQKQSDREAQGWFVPVDFVRQKLREYSICPVPANADCLSNSRHLSQHGLEERDLLDLLRRSNRELLSRRLIIPATRTTEVKMDPEEMPVEVEIEAAESEPEAKVLVCPACAHSGPEAEFMAAPAEAMAAPAEAMAVPDPSIDVGDRASAGEADRALRIARVALAVRDKVIAEDERLARLASGLLS